MAEPQAKAGGDVLRPRRLMGTTRQQGGSVIGWIVVTLALPLILPVLGMCVFMLIPLRKSDARKVTLMATVKDGQLCWGAVSFCAAALYELNSEVTNASGVARAFAGWATGTLVVIIGIAAMAAAGGAVFTTELRRRDDGAGFFEWLRHYRLFAGSPVMTAIAGIAYTVVHFNL